MPTTLRGDTAVHWETTGAGEPLVLLHGLGGDTSFWAGDVPVLAESFRVVNVDLRGSGRTPASAQGHEIADLADDVAAVLDDLGVARSHVLGFSMGGYVAQSLALRHGDRVGRLVLAATSATLNGQIARFVDAVLDVYEQGCGPKRMFDLIAPWLFSTSFVEDPAHAAYFDYPEDDPDEQSLDDWRKLYLAQRRYDGREQLQHIAAPTLVLVGGEDRFVSEPEARAFASAIPGAELIVHAGRGHLINVEDPERFHSDVRGFLTSS